MEKKDLYKTCPDLQGKEKLFIRVPKKIILDGECVTDKEGNYVTNENGEVEWLDLGLGKHRLGAYSYLFCKVAYDSTILLSLKLVYNWLHKKMDTHKNSKGIQSYIQLFREYERMGLLQLEKDIEISKILEGVVYQDKLEDMCNGENRDRFAILYLDEIEKIINYNGAINIDKAYVLLVFAYFRLMIPNQSDAYGAVEISEAFNAYYRQVEDELGLSERVVSKAVSVLIDLGILHEERRPPIVKYVYDGGKKIKKHIPQTSIFCNVYKRKDGKLIKYGESYYGEEIKKKKEFLRKDGYR